MVLHQQLTEPFYRVLDDETPARWSLRFPGGFALVVELTNETIYPEFSGGTEGRFDQSGCVGVDRGLRGGHGHIQLSSQRNMETSVLRVELLTHGQTEV
ncbi:hypothetical protein INR49_020485 [Caranx melampygus]|nr:hypothetical protein INR49_020485 [Caranx melampygus]